MVAATKPNPEKQRVIMCSDPLWKHVVKRAKRDGISLSEFIRTVLAKEFGTDLSGQPIR